MELKGGGGENKLRKMQQGKEKAEERKCKGFLKKLCRKCKICLRKVKKMWNMFQTSKGNIKKMQRNGKEMQKGIENHRKQCNKVN